MSAKVRLQIGLGALAALGAGLWIVLGSDATTSAVTPPQPVAIREATAVPPSPALTSTPDDLAEFDPAQFDDPIESGALVDPQAFGAKLEQTLALYKQQMIYPRWSRPIDGSAPHLLDWNRSIKTGQPFAADRERREIEAHVVLDHSYAGPGDRLTARIEVYRTQGRVAIAPDKIAARVEVYAGDPQGWQLATAVVVVPVASGWEATFSPSGIERLASAQRPARVVVRVEHGEFVKELPLAFRYSASAPLLVIGKTGDRIEAGSLAVDYDVDVRHAQPTLVQAVLYDGTGTRPIATYSDWFRPTVTGRQPMTITFYGKVIRDFDRSGPYRIKNLHGHVRVPQADPLEVWWSMADEPGMVTAAYRPSVFTDREYSSAEKTEAIARYQEAIRRGPPP